MNLWNAAQRIRILHPRTIDMRGVDLASREEASQIGSDFYLPGVGTSVVNTRIESGIRSLEHIERESTQGIGGFGENLRLKNRQQPNGEHRLSAVDQGNGFLGFQGNGFDLRGLERIGATHAFAFVEGFSFADEH